MEVADRYHLDWRLLPSISYVESGCGRLARHNNLFGWNSGHARFATPAASIHDVAYRLTHSDRYREKDLDALLATYNRNPRYAFRVKFVMQRIATDQ